VSKPCRAYGIPNHLEIAWRNRLDQFQNLLQRWACTDNLIEVHLTANLFFEVKSFLCEFIF
jgi:hypothetical protein